MSKPSSDSQLAFAAKAGDPKSKVSKKPRPIYTHDGVARHTVDKCFKLHGYPPGYKAKSKPYAVNQVVAGSFTGDTISIPTDQY